MERVSKSSINELTYILDLLKKPSSIKVLGETVEYIVLLNISKYLDGILPADWKKKEGFWQTFIQTLKQRSMHS